MEKIDARKLPRAALEEKRRQAVKLRERGMTLVEVGEIVGVHSTTVCKWERAYRERGMKALKLRRRGRREGSGRRLSKEQEKEVKRLLIEKTPDQLKFPYALWTREAVRELIRKRCGIDLPIRTVGHYLKRWGMTPQKPVKRAYEQQPEEVKKWLDEEYPGVRKKAKAEGAEIYWGDETGINNTSYIERGYAPRGRTPEVRVNVRRERIGMISAITNQGKVRFKFYEGGMNAEILIDFMKRLIKASGRKVYLIDNLRVHHARDVRKWLEGDNVKEKIEVFYLPSYSPELNPDEYLNCDLKRAVRSGKPARSKEQLKKKALRHMRKLQRRPARVRKYFEHESISYAA
jgi:transposase